MRGLKKNRKRAREGHATVAETHFGEVLGAAIARVGGLDLVDLLPNGFAVSGHGH